MYFYPFNFLFLHKLKGTGCSYAAGKSTFRFTADLHIFSILITHPRLYFKKTEYSQIHLW